MIIKKSSHGGVSSMAVRAKGEFFQPLGQPVWYVLGPVARYVARDLHDVRDVCLLPEKVKDIINSFIFVVNLPPKMHLI
jgi:hypothetical protein